MKKSLIATFLSLFVVLGVISQDQPLPLNIQKAYNNDTRSDDGNPGPDYWQNSADYKMEVTVDVKEDIIWGTAEINYFNNSPDTLRHLVLRLYQEFFREGSARQWAINTNDLMEGTEITRLKIEGEIYDEDEDLFGYVSRVGDKWKAVSHLCSETFTFKSRRLAVNRLKNHLRKMRLK